MFFCYDEHKKNFDLQFSYKRQALRKYSVAVAEWYGTSLSDFPCLFFRHWCSLMHELFTRPEWSTVITSTNKSRLYWFLGQICINVLHLLHCFVMFSHVMTENNTVAGGFISRLVLARLSHIWLFLIPPSSDFEKVFTYCIATIICPVSYVKYEINTKQIPLKYDCFWYCKTIFAHVIEGNPGGGRYNGKQTDRTCSKAAVQKHLQRILTCRKKPFKNNSGAYCVKSVNIRIELYFFVFHRVTKDRGSRVNFRNSLRELRKFTRDPLSFITRWKTKKYNSIPNWAGPC